MNNISDYMRSKNLNSQPECFANDESENELKEIIRVVDEHEYNSNS